MLGCSLKYKYGIHLAVIFLSPLKASVNINL